MKYYRRYIQFNDLVLDTYDMVNESPHSAEFKGSTQEYSFGHGSYAPNKRDYMFVREQSVSLSITLKMKKLPCEYRPYYKQFAIKELTKPGKLWAVVNNQMLWAYARATQVSEGVSSKQNEYRIEADFIMPEGVWHKANKAKTFLVPYSTCDFMDCLGYKEENPCCCPDCSPNPPLHKNHDCCCCCDELTKDMALCNHRDDIQAVYGECTPSFQVVYDCAKGEEFFGDKYLGERVCTKDSCSNVMAGHIYSETEIPTTGVDIIIDGSVHDAQITINGNKNIIKGDYDKLFIYSNGDVYSGDGCCTTLLDQSVWVIPTEDDDYGWTIHQGENRVVIDRGACCGFACAYIQVDSLTI